MNRAMFVPKLFVCMKNYSWPQFRTDLGAGIVVGLVALPLAMAFAIASGVGPERGLFTAVIAGFIISLLGGSRVQIGGPTGAFVVVVGAVVAKYGYQGLVLATIMAGVALIVLGIFQLGSMVKFIPYPVTTGFTSGIAIIIFSSQMKDFMGLNMGSVPLEFIDKWHAYFLAINSINLWALGIGTLTVLCIALWPKSWNKIPGSVAALVLSTTIVQLFNLPVETIQSRFGGIPQSLPSPVFPTLSWQLLRELSSPALTIALLAAIESLLSAVVADGMIGGKHKSNMELIAQGVANIFSPIFGGIPATGAIARTATNIKNGGRTPIAGIVHAIVLLLILMAFGKVAEKIPLACLAGVLIVVSYHMSEWRSFRSLLKAPSSDIAVLLVTFTLTVLIDLTVAVEVGMVLAAFLFMKRITSLTRVDALTNNFEDSDEIGQQILIPKGVQVYTIQGSFSFGAANKLLEIDKITSPDTKILILNMEGVLYIDATGMHVLRQMHRDAKGSGIRMILAGIHMQPLEALTRANLYEELGEESFKENLNAALKEY